MDLVAIDCSAVSVGEDNWITILHHLPIAAEQSSMSQYELLTGLGERFERIWN